MSETKRKLAAIVFTDIVGFTKLTAKNQSKASSLLKKQRELFRPIIESFNGKWIKEMGDGLLGLNIMTIEIYLIVLITLGIRGLNHYFRWVRLVKED